MVLSILGLIKISSHPPLASIQLSMESSDPFIPLHSPLVHRPMALAPPIRTLVTAYITALEGFFVRSFGTVRHHCYILSMRQFYHCILYLLNLAIAIFGLFIHFSRGYFTLVSIDDDRRVSTFICYLLLTHSPCNLELKLLDANYELFKLVAPVLQYIIH
jgi:hypothetical protein